jgi:hypothetical protein
MLRFHGRSTHANRGESFRFQKSGDSITDMNAEPRSGFPNPGISSRINARFSELVAGKFVN